MSIQSNIKSHLRVAYLNFSNNGGMLHYVLNLGEAAAEYVDVTYIDVGLEPTPEYVNTGKPVLFFRWPAGRNRASNAYQKYRPKNFRALASRIVTHAKPDIVHITSTSLGLLSLIRHLHNMGVCIVYTLHDPQPHHEQRTLWGKLYTFYQQSYQNKQAYKYCSAVHVHSVVHADIIRKLYGEPIFAKTYVVAHGGGATTSILNGERTPFELSAASKSSKTRFLFFGRIEPYKGLRYLFQAQSLLNNQSIDCEIVVAGHGTLPLDTPLPAGTILINRFIADDEIRVLFEQSDIVVLPYVEATQTGVISLAYYFSKPVICTCVGALAEMVINHETGILIPPHDAQSLAEAMLFFIKDKQNVNKLGQGGRRMLEETLSWSKVVKEHHKHYLQLNKTEMISTLAFVQPSHKKVK